MGGMIVLDIVKVEQHGSRNIAFVRAYICTTEKGAMPTEFTKKEREEFLKNNQKGESCTRYGWLDLVMLKKIIKEQNIQEIGICHLEELGKMPVQYVCTQYKQGITIIKNAPEDLSSCKPMYHTFYGAWDMKGCHKWCKIPDRAKYYMEYISRYLRIPVKYVKLNSPKSKVIQMQENNH